jgi:TrmH family RNA methyltransferase
VARVRIVLVRAASAANVGACARIVRNCGSAGLDLVRPGDWRTVECWRSAWGAQDVLEQARVFDDLAAALAGAGLAVAFSGRRPRQGEAVDVRDAAAEVAALGRDETAALVFGPEASGLSNDELLLCGRAATIPSHPAQPSYNLSHAVAIAAYETHRAARKGVRERPRRATHDEKERLLLLLREGLRAIRALPERNQERYFAGWRALLQRCELSRKELRRLEHVGRKMAAAFRDA